MQGPSTPRTPPMQVSPRIQAVEQPVVNEHVHADKDAEPHGASGAFVTEESGDAKLHVEDDETGESLAPRKSMRQFNAPGTVRAGGAMLAFCAGMVNAVAFHALSTFVSHMTGSLSKVGLGLEGSGPANARDSMLLVVSFVIGSMLTGFLIARDTINIGLSLYDLCLLCEATLLTFTTFFHEYKISRYLAAAACGLQNGMATHWGGAVIRTTHVTGLFTDVGLMLGRRISIFCRKRCGASFDEYDRALFEDDLSKLSVLFTIAVAFLLGIFVGAHLYNSMKHLAFLIPAGITGIAGIAYTLYRVVVLGRSFFSAADMNAETIEDFETRSNCTRSRAAAVVGV